MATSSRPDSKSTQQFVDVQSIKNGVVFLRGGGMRKIILVSGINFALKSEEEQNIILGAYQGFLNSLDFPIQIVVHSRKINIEKYINKLSGLKEEESNDLLKEQIEEYVNFIKSFVEVNDIMNKNFFVSVPYEYISTQEGAGKIMSMIPFGKNKSERDMDEKESMDEKIQQLNQRVEHVLNGLGAIGLRVVPLNDEELTELFYNLYNPQLAGAKEIKL